MLKTAFFNVVVYVPDDPSGHRTVADVMHPEESYVADVSAYALATVQPLIMDWIEIDPAASDWSKNADASIVRDIGLTR